MNEVSFLDFPKRDTRNLWHDRSLLISLIPTRGFPQTILVRASFYMPRSMVPILAVNISEPLHLRIYRVFCKRTACIALLDVYSKFKYFWRLKYSFNWVSHNQGFRNFREMVSSLCSILCRRAAASNFENFLLIYYAIFEKILKTTQNTTLRLFPWNMVKCWAQDYPITKLNVFINWKNEKINFIL